MKSHVSDLLELATVVYEDAVAKCTDVSLDVRDLLTLKSRVEHEGLSFLTITLPNLGKDFEEALSLGRISSTHFRGFRKRGKAPAFLQGFFSCVFDETGRIKHEICPATIESIRQLAYTFKKLEIPCSPNRVARSLANFALIERDHFNSPVCTDSITRFRNICRVLWAPVLHNCFDSYATVPKHGPGATADRLLGNQKFNLRRWHERLEPYFPVLDFAFTTADARFSTEFEKVSLVTEEQEQPVRVVTVPKTLKAPRIIAIEPTCMQYTQQAIARRLVSRLETHPLTSGGVNFTYQWINRALAMISSETGKLATLDLSSASDLVPYELAISMFDSNPDLRDAISACRSTRAQMPGGEVIHLKKFASMGSALCFPVEAMYFYTLCIKALIEERNLPVTTESVRLVCSDVFVYGDDIIVPTHESEAVSRTLREYYCKVNTTKSFYTGKFRESCGMDAYDGEEVTPTYIRHVPPRDRRTATEVVSWTATSNLFYRKGYWRTCSFLRKKVESTIGKLPLVGPQSSVLGWHSFQKSFVSADRWSKRFQCPEVRTWVAAPVYSDDAIENYAALTKCLLRLEDGLPVDEVDPKHLVRSARHGAVALKRRWVTRLN